ncbi:hypothetical protein Ahy_B01g054338 [Arachis hypogaea]|uniref:Uncharacterized protein n=1 Tax=Arachis hypogaea TaxID=3818 RepID=A0A445ATR7_ARAHY|nr:hypothetical protein Ahy_B01g054338 [Arachis hypogaea]
MPGHRDGVRVYWYPWERDSSGLFPSSQGACSPFPGRVFLRGPRSGPWGGPTSLGASSPLQSDLPPLQRRRPTLQRTLPPLQRLQPTLQRPQPTLQRALPPLQRHQHPLQRALPPLQRHQPTLQRAQHPLQRPQPTLQCPQLQLQLSQHPLQSDLPPLQRHPANVATHPASVATPPANVATCPASVATPPANVATPPASVATSPASVATSPASVAARPASGPSPTTDQSLCLVTVMGYACTGTHGSETAVACFRPRRVPANPFLGASFCGDHVPGLGVARPRWVPALPRKTSFPG